MTKPTPDSPAPGQDSVWLFPRPAIARPTDRHIRIVHGGRTVADSRRCVMTLETSHPPTYYIPPQDVTGAVLLQSNRRSMCEWKGQATYLDVVVGGEVLRDAAWCYPQPTAPFASIAGFAAFYPARFEACYVDGEQAIPQPGMFYGGWITSHVAGPFKGVPGSEFW